LCDVQDYLDGNIAVQDDPVEMKTVGLSSPSCPSLSLAYLFFPLYHYAIHLLIAASRPHFSLNLQLTHHCSRLCSLLTHTPLSLTNLFLPNQKLGSVVKRLQEKQKKRSAIVPLQEGEYDKKGNLLPAYRDDFIVEDNGTFYYFF